MAKYLPEAPVLTAKIAVTVDAETAEMIGAWKRQLNNITTVLIMCALAALDNEDALVTGYERRDFVKYTVVFPVPLLEAIKKAADRHGMNRSEFLDACVRTMAHGSRTGKTVRMSALLPSLCTPEEMEEIGIMSYEEMENE